MADVHLIKAGDKVGASEAALLGKLGVRPFKYGLEVVNVYDGGSLFSPAVLDITDDMLAGSAAAAIANVAALSLELGYPTLASIPHRWAARHGARAAGWHWGGPSSKRSVHACMPRNALPQAQSLNAQNVSAWLSELAMLCPPLLSTAWSTATRTCWRLPWRRTTPSPWRTR